MGQPSRAVKIAYARSPKGRSTLSAWRKARRNGPPIIGNCLRCGMEMNIAKANQRLCSKCKWERSKDRINERRRANPEARLRAYRKWYLMETFRISPERYDQMLAEQGGKCGICERKPPFGRLKFLSVDHDHNTGIIRGLLCSHCNSFLGRIKDDGSKVVSYLNKRTCNGAKD